jgi:surfactin synthase thioesterase subunit
VSPPGTLYRDCEHNYLLLGALIEHCSHMTFQRYMARNVLGPLSMTTIGVLPPPNQGTDSSDFLKHMRPTAYTVTNMQGRRVRLPLPPLPYPIPLSPVTGLVATPKEISNMLLACLQASNPSDPDSGGRGLLMEDSLGEMHAAHFRSQGSELAFGFLRRELWDDGPMLLFHSADEVLGADCLFCLFPEHRVGVWIGCNTTPEDPQDSPSAHADDSEPEEEQRFCEEILEAFIQRFFPLHGGKNAAEQSLWFYTPPPLRADPLLNLYCFPFVGGSAPVMYENWPAMLPDFIQVRTVQLPGRGSRVKEPPNGNMLVLAEQVGIAMLPLVSGGEPFAFFGHGMGAVLAYEVARYIQRRVGRAPLHFFCSGQVSPAYHSLKGQGSHSWGESLSKGTSDRVMGDSSFARPQRLHLLPDHDLAFTLASCTRISRQFRKNSLMLRAMMGTIRADIQAEESYQWVPHLYDGRKSRPRAGSLGRGRGAEREQGGGTAEEREQRERDGPWDGPALLCPMTIYVGLQDEHTSEKGLQGWQQLSRGPCQLQRLPGDHFYLEDGKSREHLLKSIGHTLVGHLSRHSNWITMMHAGTGARPIIRSGK